MKVLVTGAAGFIGSHLVNRLIEDDHDVTCIDNESSLNEKHYWNTRASNHKLDIVDNSIFELFEDVDFVFHLAAESKIPLCVQNPKHAFATNVMGTCNVLEACRANGIKRLMYSSTSSAYGLTDEIPQTENTPEDCLNPYSVSKVSGEQICKMYSDLYGVDSAVFRYFNVYGEGAPSRGQYSPVTSIFLRQKRENTPLTIVGDGSNRRDYIHVSDVVDANIKAAFLEQKISGNIFNIGSGVNYSVKELADLISDNQIHIAERLSECKETLANSLKAKNVLGWISRINLKEWLINNMESS
jgi:UDP-glucose 4-epimerase